MPMLSGIKDILENNFVEHIFTGHAGDANWHIHLFYEDQLGSNILESIERIDRLLWRHQGHISGEYGIGQVNKARWQLFAGDDWKLAYNMLKQQFDPKGRLPSMI